jgi:hypothetical protein
MCGLKILGAIENFSDREKVGEIPSGRSFRICNSIADTIAYDKSIATAAANGQLQQRILHC